MLTIDVALCVATMYVAWGESTLDMTWRGPVKVTLIVTVGLSVSTMHVEWGETTYRGRGVR